MSKTSTSSSSKTVTKTVDQYLAELPEEMRELLEGVRKAIKKAAPKCEELISYQVPTYKQLGPLVHFAAFKGHCSLIVVRKDILKIFVNELASFKTNGATIRFTPEHPLPSTLVQKIIKTRVQQNEEHAAMNPMAGKLKTKTSKSSKKRSSNAVS